MRRVVVLLAVLILTGVVVASAATLDVDAGFIQTLDVETELPQVPDTTEAEAEALVTDTTVESAPPTSEVTSTTTTTEAEPTTNTTEAATTSTTTSTTLAPEKTAPVDTEPEAPTPSDTTP
ncbi:MAG TPA: hypothetical protein VF377_05105 [Acidimicrobiia bacterium]|jgi:hypothetical protein